MINLGVIFGGKSCEHEISVLTANQVMASLDLNKYKILPIYISKDQKFYYIKDYSLEVFKKSDFIKSKNFQEISFVKNGFRLKRKKVKLDVALLSMHGTNGEDGNIQAFLNFFDICYVGSNILACALSQDKVFSRQINLYNGIKALEYEFLYEEDLNDFKLKKLKYPIIAKAANLGSSIGIEVIHHEEELKIKLEKLFKYDKKIILEPYIKEFREFNIALAKFAGKICTSFVEEVKKTNEILDFTNKYQGGKELRIIPAKISEKLKKEISETALRVYKLLDFESFVRFDFIYFEDSLYLNEINTTPGSLSYYLWDKSFKEMLDARIKDSFKAFTERNEKTTTFDTNILFTVNSLKK